MLRAIPTFVLCLVSAGTGQEDSKPVRKGVWTLMGTVRELVADVLVVNATSDNFVEAGKLVKLKVTKDSRLEQLDSKLVDGKPTLTRKTIKVDNLILAQPISLVLFSDGRELILLSAVVTGPRLGGVMLSAEVAILGGKVARTNIKGQNRWSVDLKGTQTSDADLARIGPMPDLLDLDLSFTRVTDKGVAGLVGHDDLVHLNLMGTQVSDAAIDDLRQLPNLFTINLAETAITADGIARPVKNKSVNQMLDQLIAWSGALRILRVTAR